jgi:hypothetical protein
MPRINYQGHPPQSPFFAAAKGEEELVSLLEEGLREVTVFLFPSSPLKDSDTR